MITINPEESNTLTLYIDAVKNGDLCGRIYHRNTGTLLPFIGVNNLLLKMDRMLDAVGIPQNTFANRTFMNRRKKAAEPMSMASSPSPNADAVAASLPPEGDEATFLIYVQYRQNAAWQGELLWKDHEEQHAFYSSLELLKLLDSTLNVLHSPMWNR